MFVAPRELVSFFLQTVGDGICVFDSSQSFARPVQNNKQT